MFAYEKGTKYYIHLLLYFVIIILLSVSLTGPWIKIKDESNYASLDCKFNLFKIKVKSEINTLHFIEDLFDIEVAEKKQEILTPVDDEREKNKILLKKFTPIKVIEDIDINNLDLKDIRNQLVDTINLSGDTIEYNGSTYKIILTDRVVGLTDVRKFDYVQSKLLETVNNLFNKSRDNDNEIETMGNDKQKAHVKSGELKDTLLKVEKYVKQFFTIIQIVIIICIVLLFLHFLLILFKGRRTGIFRFSGIITVFLPLIALLFLAVVYILLASVGADNMTEYYLLYTIASILLFVTWFLGLFKAI
jgi:hypothetical protein